MKLSRLSAFVFACAALTSASLAGCGSSSSGATPDGGGHDSGKPGEAGRDVVATESGHDGGKPETGIPDAGGPDMTPITGLTTNVWTWVAFPKALCRDGSSTGIGVNKGSSNNLMIFLEGGGACFNVETCLQNPSSFSATDFMARTTSTMDGDSVNVGILDRTNAANPVKDWSFVYVPYCSGDIHGGNNAAPVPGVAGGTPQVFHGFTNMGLYLDRVVPTFPTPDQVLLTGMSAGGFGAAVNYARTAKAFGSTPVAMIDDSGPFMEDPSLATCLQDQVRTLWGLDGTVLAECAGDCPTSSSFFLDYMKHVLKAYPSVGFGLADSTDDGTITQFFGFGLNKCAPFTAPESAGMFTSGLLDIRSKLAAQTNYGEFIFTGTDHTTIQNANFYTRTAGGMDGSPGVLMTDWVKSVLASSPTNAGP